MDSSTNPQTMQDGQATAASGVSVVAKAGARISSNRDIAVVQADYLALANDLEQAQALASTLELELSGKTNELARFKLIWERTQSDLTKFEHDLDVMRKERHSLANEVQKAYAIEHKYERLKIAHEDLAAKADRLEAELMREKTAHLLTREELERRGSPSSLAAINRNDAHLRETLEAVRDQIDRLLGGKGNGKPPAAASRPPVAPKAEPDHIDIEFST